MPDCIHAISPICTPLPYDARHPLQKLAQVSCPVAVTESREHFALSQKAREVIPRALEALVSGGQWEWPSFGLDCYVSDKKDCILLVVFLMLRLNIETETVKLLVCV